jgi:Ni/Fe-hydrogenase subunit HybB-like protein
VAVTVVAVVATVIFVISAMILVAAAHGVPVELMAMAVPMEFAVLSVMRIFAVVPVVRVIAVIYMSVPAVGAMEPWACSEEDAIRKPVWTVIAIGSAIVGGVIEVSIGTGGGRSHVHAEAKRHLGICRRSGKEG